MIRLDIQSSVDYDNSQMNGKVDKVANGRNDQIRTNFVGLDNNRTAASYVDFTIKGGNQIRFLFLSVFVCFRLLLSYCTVWSVLLFSCLVQTSYMYNELPINKPS